MSLQKCFDGMLCVMYPDNVTRSCGHPKNVGGTVAGDPGGVLEARIFTGTPC